MRTATMHAPSWTWAPTRRRPMTFELEVPAWLRKLASLMAAVFLVPSIALVALFVSLPVLPLLPLVAVGALAVTGDVSGRHPSPPLPAPDEWSQVQRWVPMPRRLRPAG